MLSNEYRHAVDAKNRLFIPAKHREKLGDSFMVIRSVSEKCLNVYSLSEWSKFEDKLKTLPASQTRDLIRFIYRNAIEAVPDSQGRILLTQGLKDYAMIDKNTVIVGCGTYAEIWSEDKYDEKVEQENPSAYNELLMNFGF